MDRLEEMMCKWNIPGENGSDYQPALGVHHPVLFLEVDGPHPHQAAIRIGRKLFTQHHEDFNGLFVLNTILGGYFGSRLMNEIRENLGLTYGIYSGIDSFAQDGCFYISTETTTQQIDVMLKAIQLEAEKLRQDLIPEAELNMARNYLMGHLMTQLDGPFLSMDSIKTLKIEGLPDSAFQRLVRTIQEINPEQLRVLAEQYLDLEKWSTIVVR
jgi:predicted Zn-dependent peptidase